MIFSDSNTGNIISTSYSSTTRNSFSQSLSLDGNASDVNSDCNYYSFSLSVPHSTFYF